jgi:hypothetical protein
MIENTAANDTLTITIVQQDGEKILSELMLSYPNLPNAAANLMQLQVVDTIRALVQSWTDAKASGADPLA